MRLISPSVTRLSVAALALAVSATMSATMSSTASAQAGARRAAPSTRGLAEVSLTLVDTAAQRAAGKPALFKIDYGQPHLRGRRINTDSLVPWDKAWRLGANGATILTTDVDLTIGGKAVPKGRYTAQALPTKSGWTLILQQELTGAASVNADAYDAKKDFARIDLTVKTVATPMETFSIWLIPSTAPGVQRGELRMAWDTTVLSTEWVVR